MDSDKKLNRPRRWSDDNSSTFFLRKVELRMFFINTLHYRKQNGGVLILTIAETFFAQLYAIINQSACKTKYKPVTCGAGKTYPLGGT